uniref:Disease resistance protein RPP13 n=1 Tax=Aegilops tauschii subsp. strangulata TaxID=200361 RepID=A0A453A1P5_AEGTS
MSLSVSVTMGVMRPLLGKLAALAGGEYSKLKGVKKQASFLEKELSAMNAALEKMELMDELDPVARDWRDHVREMSYDMENCIDDFVHQFGGGNAKLGFMKKTARSLKMLGQRHRIADRMEELKTLALEANERRIRYLIIVDDLWDQSAWNTISRAFPESANGSRVIITTRVESVASAACCSRPEFIYRMKPLNKQDSKKLFFGRVYGSEDDHQFEEITAEILKKCGELPLAIITIASLLASRPEKLRDEWESIRNSLGTHFAVNPTVEGVKNILNLSYIHLPLHLRACFLHLGLYPEDREIERDDLVRQWLAEGLVSKLHGQDSEVVAKSYFNDLINRSLIQPGCNKDGELVSCRVHDMMLDLILSKCEEHNFLRVECSPEEMARDHGRKYKVRRISMNLGNGGVADEATSRIIPSSVSQVRSLALFGESKYMPPLLHFKHLKVFLFKSLGGE